jgi:hypothetical protein
MNISRHIRWSALAVLVAGLVCTSTASAQSGWGYGPGSAWGPGPHHRGYGMGPGMMGPNMIGPGMMGPGMGRNMPAFEAFDSNDDGRISEKELQQTRAERQRQRAQQGYPMRGAAYAPSFADLDKDGDGSLSPDELRSYRDRRQQSWMGWR